LFILTTNDKTVKLWKISHKVVKKTEPIGSRKGVT